MASEVTFELVTNEFPSTPGVHFNCPGCTAIGTFDFNTVTDAVSGVAINTTGSGHTPPEYTSGTFTDYSGTYIGFAFTNGGVSTLELFVEEFNATLLLNGRLNELLNVDTGNVISQEIGAGWSRPTATDGAGFVTIAPVPEPGSLLLLGTGLFGLGLLRWRKAA